MAINVNAANNQASQLNNNASQLRNARKQMVAYKASVSNNWQGKEVGYIITAIDQVIGDIDSAIRNLDSLSTDIRNTAAQIRREEEEAAKRQRIQVAQSAHDQACIELDQLCRRRAELEEMLRRASYRERPGLLNELQALNNQIGNAENKCRSTYDALMAAKR